MTLPHKGLVIAVLVCISGQVLYHVVMKGVPPSAPALLVVVAAYGFAIVAVLVVCSISGGFRADTDLSGAILIRAATLGVAVALVEIGYIYAYRNGLSLEVGAITVLALTTVVLVPVGISFFKEVLSSRLVLGLATTLIGLWLVAGAPKGK